MQKTGTDWKFVSLLLQIKPHHKVLEIGFGPGHGIKYSLRTGTQNGTGKFVGVDFSKAMCDDARRRFSNDIASGKVEILNDDVAAMSLPDNEFDKVFHTNCHLYWPDLDAACNELYRVMKPNSDMVTVMNLIRIRKITGNMKVLKHAKNLAPEPYMESLSSAGFTGIDILEVKRPIVSSLHAVVCRKPGLK